jgi:lysophospholipase L1-like esterase
MKKFLKTLLIIAMIATLCLQPSATALSDDDILDRFDTNKIYYYNPKGSDDQCSSTATTLVGADMTEKIWNFFISKGFSDAQTAGILGNIKAETDVQPTYASGPTYWSFFQMKDERKAGLFKKLKEAGLFQYTSSEYWPSGAWKKIPENDLDRLVEVELEYAYSEYSRDWKNEIKKQNTPEAAAEVFLTLYERAVDGAYPILYYEPFIGLKYQGAEDRRNFAREFFEQYSGKGVSMTNLAGAETGNNLSIIGDSITVGSTDAILKQFPQLQASDINAQNGRKWETGIEIAKESALNDNVIYALGTNSANIPDDKILEALQAIGVNKKIVLVTNYSTEEDGRFDKNNANYLEYAKKNSNIVVADWNAAVSKEPSKYMADHFHPNEEGKALFAKTLYDALNSNVSTNGCSVNGDFINLVKAYAWPDYHKAPFTDRMPAYAEAVATSMSEGRYVGGSVNGVPGIDCGGFVTILVQNSGIEPNYNDGKGGTDAQEVWVKEHNWTLLNATYDTPIDTSVLQPGDVALSLGHTFIYVGEIPGFNSVIASASYGESSARAPMAGHEDLIRSPRSLVRWYRNPKYSGGNSTSLNTNLQNTVYNENKR